MYTITQPEDARVIAWRIYSLEDDEKNGWQRINDDYSNGLKEVEWCQANGAAAPFSMEELDEQTDNWVQSLNREIKDLKEALADVPKCVQELCTTYEKAYRKNGADDPQTVSLYHKILFHSGSFLRSATY